MKKLTSVSLVVVTALAGISSHVVRAQTESLQTFTYSEAQHMGISSYLMHADIWLCSDFLLPSESPEPSVHIVKYITWYKEHAQVNMPYHQMASLTLPRTRDVQTRYHKVVKSGCFIGDLFLPRTYIARRDQVQAHFV